MEELSPFIAHKKRNKHRVKPTIGVRLNRGYYFFRVNAFIRAQIVQQKFLRFWRLIWVALPIHAYLDGFLEQEGVVIVAINHGFTRTR